MTLPPVILFDLDDTILSFSASADECWRELCAEFSGRLRSSESALYAGIDASREWFWSDPERSRRGRLDMEAARRAIVGDAFSKLGFDAPDLARQLADRYTATREERVAPFPGAIETLAELRRRGRTLALLTNGSSKFQRRKIDRFELSGFFDLIWIEGEMGVGKPDRRVFLGALEELDASPGDAWMVGDNLTADIEPAQQLGLTTVWVDHASTGLPNESPVEPTRSVAAISELLL
jgi:putative hydrolase of the HAD superfamily